MFLVFESLKISEQRLKVQGAHKLQLEIWMKQRKQRKGTIIGSRVDSLRLRISELYALMEHFRL